MSENEKKPIPRPESVDGGEPTPRELMRGTEAEYLKILEMRKLKPFSEGRGHQHAPRGGK